MKDTIQNYGWIVISLVVLSILVALASPFATAIADNVMIHTNDLGDQMENAPDYVPPYAVRLNSNNSKGGTVEFTGDYSGGKIFLKTTATVTLKATPAEGYEFLGWYVDGVLVSEDLEYTADVSKEITFTAKFSNGSFNGGEQLPAGGEVSETGEILDSWEVIINNVNNGTYSAKYAVGNYKPLDLGTEGIVNMQIAALDADDMTGGGKAHITWIAKDLLKTMRNMNSTDTSANGWEASEMRTYLQNDIWVLIDSAVQNAIVAVDKTYYDKATSSTKTCSDKVWIPSYYEIFGDTILENPGVVYSELFANDASRVKYWNGSVVSNWWLRSAYTNSGFCCVGNSGGAYHTGAGGLSGVALSFCF